MLHVTCWQWGAKYPPHYIERLSAGVRRNLRVEHRFIVCRPHVEDEVLTQFPGCFARLRAFDLDWQKSHGIAPGDRILNLDLDNVIVGPIDGIALREEPFVILQGVNAKNPNPYNGSIWSLKAGYRPDVWSEFSPEKAKSVPYFAFPDDQAWFHHKLRGAAAYTVKDGCYGFQKPGWITGDRLPMNANIVCFFGSRDPSKFTHLDWVQHHWR